jgi:hypothetical protein
MSSHSIPDIALRFNPLPNWPVPAPGWTPPPGWAPDPSWPAPREGWQLWIGDATAGRDRLSADMGGGLCQSPGRQGWPAWWQSFPAKQNWSTVYKGYDALAALLILIGGVAMAIIGHNPASSTASNSSSGGTTNYYSPGEQYVATAYADGDTSPAGWTAETWCSNTIFARQSWPNMTQIRCRRPV